MLERDHIMVDNYRASDLDKEIIPKLNFRDILFICAYFAVTRLFLGLVIPKLQIPYLIFNIAVGVWLTRPAGNASYPKRLYHTIWYKLSKTHADTVFHAIEPEVTDIASY